jgi:hypothetical protein
MASNYDQDYGHNSESLGESGSSSSIVLGSGSDSVGFVNKGLQRWEKSRAKWLASCAANKLEKRPQPKDVDIDQVTLTDYLLPSFRGTIHMDSSMKHRCFFTIAYKLKTSSYSNLIGFATLNCRQL